MALTLVNEGRIPPSLRRRSPRHGDEPDYDGLIVAASSENILQSLGEHIAILNVDGHRRVPACFSERRWPQQAPKATHGCLQMKRTCPSRDLFHHEINVEGSPRLL
jgi:hypothetical protein